MSDFQSVCAVNDLVKNSGVSALVNDKQVALFYIDGQVYAIDNYDPIGKAYVMSRGMTGSKGDELVVASPLYKENYSLKTGVCLDDDSVSVAVYDAKIAEDKVLVKV